MYWFLLNLLIYEGFCFGLWMCTLIQMYWNDSLILHNVTLSLICSALRVLQCSVLWQTMWKSNPGLRIPKLLLSQSSFTLFLRAFCVGNIVIRSVFPQPNGTSVFINIFIIRKHLIISLPAWDSSLLPYSLIGCTFWPIFQIPVVNWLFRIQSSVQESSSSPAFPTLTPSPVSGKMLFPSLPSKQTAEGCGGALISTEHPGSGLMAALTWRSIENECGLLQPPAVRLPRCSPSRGLDSLSEKSPMAEIIGVDGGELCWRLWSASLLFPFDGCSLFVLVGWASHSESQASALRARISCFSHSHLCYFLSLMPCWQESSFSYTSASCSSTSSDIPSEVSFPAPLMQEPSWIKSPNLSLKPTQFHPSSVPHQRPRRQSPTLFDAQFCSTGIEPQHAHSTVWVCGGISCWVLSPLTAEGLL